MSASIKVAARTETGKLRNKRLRMSGQIPAVLYGAGGESISLSVPALEFGRLLKAGSKSMELSGAVSGKVEVKEIQRDTFGTEILHIDFVRV